MKWNGASARWVAFFLNFPSLLFNILHDKSFLYIKYFFFSFINWIILSNFFSFERRIISPDWRYSPASYFFPVFNFFNLYFIQTAIIIFKKRGYNLKSFFLAIFRESDVKLNFGESEDFSEWSFSRSYWNNICLQTSNDHHLSKNIYFQNIL